MFERAGKGEIETENGRASGGFGSLDTIGFSLRYHFDFRVIMAGLGDTFGLSTDRRQPLLSDAWLQFLHVPGYVALVV